MYLKHIPISKVSVPLVHPCFSGRLAPLLGREDDIDHSHPNPPLVTPRISPTKGGEPSQAGDYTISLPVGGGSIPKHGGGAIVSVPGDQPLAYRSDHRETLPMSTVRGNKTQKHTPSQQ